MISLIMIYDKFFMLMLDQVVGVIIDVIVYWFW